MRFCLLPLLPHFCLLYFLNGIISGHTFWKILKHQNPAWKIDNPETEECKPCKIYHFFQNTTFWYGSSPSWKCQLNKHSTKVRFEGSAKVPTNLFISDGLWWKLIMATHNFLRARYIPGTQIRTLPPLHSKLPWAAVALLLILPGCETFSKLLHLSVVLAPYL